MEKLTKENKGITLVSLIITIILMLILTSVTTYSGINTYKRMQVTKFITQMQLIQVKVDELKDNKSIEDLLKMGEVVPNGKQAIITTAQNKGEVADAEIDSYRYFSSQDLEQELDLEDGINGEILVNFATREVVSTTGIEYENEKYYTQYLLPNAQTIIQYNSNNSIERKLDFNIDVVIDGLNATVKINGNKTIEVDGTETLKENGLEITNATLSYKKEGSKYWNTITNYTEKGKEYSILISESDTYEFKITDNITGENSNEKATDETTPEKVPEKNKKKILLTNKPKTEKEINSYNYSMTSENWAYTTDEKGNSYVWIPRFAYKTNEETEKIEKIKFIKGNSDIATDNSRINNTWTVHQRFVDPTNGEKLTGIWVQSGVLDGLNNIDMVTVLNNAVATSKEI